MDVVEQAKEQLKSFFVVDAVAKKLDIQTTEEEINGYIAQAAMYRQVRPEKLRDQMARDGSLAQVALEIREIKCIDKILESAKITEVKPALSLPKGPKKTEPKPIKKAAKKKETEKKDEKAEPKKTAKPIKKSPKKKEK
jgi:FKBP-type peptidyl-prolyl cis-trans isomerase (trigger factor)